ncbi:hypothetical protein [Halomicrococcus sp. NG-SE-24]|uniref:hypothetical protein n=1 Tax=Halomicrococcus sp. NG-SE-24 TaxID=3436928 RepID=UPI003D99CAD0
MTVDSPSRRRVLGAVSALGAGSIAGYLDAGTDGQEEQTRSESPRQVTAESCEIPVFTDKYVGFSVGRPEGWTIEYTGGIIWLAPIAPDDPTLAFVYPGWLEAGASVDDVASEFVAGLNDANADGGTSLHWNAETGSLTGTRDGKAVEGEVWTEQSGQYGLIAGGLGPEGAWSSLRETVANIPACLDLFPSVPLVVRTASASDAYGATTWEYAAPEGWQAGGATSLTIDVYGARNEQDGLYDAQVSVSSYPVIPGTTSFTHEEYLDAYLQSQREAGVYWEILDRGEPRLLGELPDGIGGSWELKAFPLLMNFGYQDMVVVVVTAITNWQNYTLSMFWWRAVAARRWDELAAISAIVQSSITILSHQPGAGLSPPVADSGVSDIIAEVGDANSAAQDRIGDQFSGALLGNDRVVIDDYPDTEILVPSNNYDPAQCPEGQRPIPHPATGEMVCGTVL